MGMLTDIHVVRFNKNTDEKFNTNMRLNKR